jgi:transcriptional regulator with XRE-family HTH domain
MNTFNDVWWKLGRDKKYRASFALAFLKRSIPFQIKVLRKKHCGSQAILAERANLTQGVVSRAEDQDYGNLTFNTVGRIAAGFDLAFIGRFVPFSDLVKFSQDLSEEEFAGISTFEEETAALNLGSVQPSLIDVPSRKQPKSEEGAAAQGMPGLVREGAA